MPGREGCAAGIALQLLLPELSAKDREAALSQALGRNAKKRSFEKARKLKLSEPQ